MELTARGCQIRVPHRENGRIGTPHHPPLLRPVTVSICTLALYGLSCHHIETAQRSYPEWDAKAAAARALAASVASRLVSGGGGGAAAGGFGTTTKHVMVSNHHVGSIIGR